MALDTENIVYRNPANRCRICLNATNGKIVLNQTIIYEKAEIATGELLKFCFSEQLFKNGQADGLCLDCTEKAMVGCEFKKKFEESQNILIKEIEEDNSFAVKLEEDYEEKVLVVKEETEVVKVENLDDGVEHESSDIDWNNHNAVLETQQQQQNFSEASISFKEHEIDECEKIIFRYKQNQPCYYCSYIPRSSKAFTDHLKNAHNNITADGTQIPCPTCKKIFYKSQRLDDHMLIHTGTKKHKCEHCGKSFSQAGTLAAHRRIHTGEKPYTCSECGKGFAQYATLKYHQTIHSSQRDHVCQQCGAAFGGREALSKHEKTHDAERPNKCTICTKAYRLKSDLKKHVATHTNVRNYACESCGKRFYRISSLRDHKKIHTGEKPHACQICGKAFIQASNMKAHMNIHAKKEINLK